MTPDERRRWASLTPQQLAVARDLHVRALALLDADPELTVPEALDIAAIEGGHEAVTKPRALDDAHTHEGP